MSQNDMKTEKVVYRFEIYFKISFVLYVNVVLYGTYLCKRHCFCEYMANICTPARIILYSGIHSKECVGI